MSKAECGTSAAYRRHLRKGEPIDVACQMAARDDTRRRRETARTEPIQHTPHLASTDPFTDAHANLAIVCAAMTTAPASAIAALSKRRQELIAEIAMLERPAALDPVDEITARRARRGAWNASMSDTSASRV